MRHILLPPFVCAAVAAGVACGPAAGARHDERQIVETRPAEATTLVERIAIGRLVVVDSDARTFRLSTDQGAGLAFRYDDDTEIAHTGGPQGLSGTDGMRVTVLYVPETSPTSLDGRAVKIVISP